MLSLLKILIFGIVSTFIATSSFAEEANSALVSEHSVFVFNTLLFLIGGFLVMWMAAGFAMLEAGLVRSKNVTTQLTKNIALFSIAAMHIFSWFQSYVSRRWMVNHRIPRSIFSPTGLEPVGATVEQIGDIGYHL